MLTDTEPSPKLGENIERNYEPDSIQSRVTWGLAFERAWPYLVAILATTLYLIFGVRRPLVSGTKDVLATSVGFAGAISGFLFAAAAILVTVSNSWFMRRAKEAGLYTRLIQYLFTAVAWCLVVAVLGCILSYFDVSWRLFWYPYAAGAWIFSASLAMSCLIRALRIFVQLMKYIANE